MTTRLSMALLLLAAACVTAEKRPPAEAVRQAEARLPAPAEVAAGPERDAYAAAVAREAKGDAAGGEQARADWAHAADAYAALAEKPAGAAWRVALRQRAAELLVRAQRWDRAAEVAGALGSDPAADDAARAVGARLAATAALGAASAAARAGQLEKLDLGPERKAQRPPPPPWQRVVETADAYLAREGADPEARKPPAERRGVSPAELALVAAEVAYSYGDLDGARGRFEAVLERWAGEVQVLEQAAPLYLATFLARGDRQGHDAAVDRLDARVAREAERAGPAEKEAFGKVREGLGRARAGARFGAAERLLAEGKPAEAAKAFEAVAAAPGGADPANALHNAAIAWDRAGEPARAASARERILKDHAGAPVAADNALLVAAHRSRGGDHAGAARLYGEFLERWPDSPSRCLALQNVASELDLAGRGAEAAARYAAFGGDGACAKAEPDLAARALVRAGNLFEGQAKAAYEGAAALPGVEGAEARKKVAEAKRRLKEL